MNHKNITSSDLKMFFGEKSEKYIRFWEISFNKQKPKKMGMYFWHWPTFFTGPIWMCYRKLY